MSMVKYGVQQYWWNDYNLHSFQESNLIFFMEVRQALGKYFISWTQVKMCLAKRQ